MAENKSLNQIKDDMGVLHNDIIELIRKSPLTIPQTYLVFAMIKEELMEAAKKLYVTKEES